MVRDQLKRSSTVGQILDIMKFSVKMLVVEKGGGDAESSGIVTTDDVLLLNEIFQMLPEQWTQDPVKVRDTKSYSLFFLPYKLNENLMLKVFIQILKQENFYSEFFQIVFCLSEKSSILSLIAVNFSHILCAYVLANFHNISLTNNHRVRVNYEHFV